MELPPRDVAILLTRIVRIVVATRGVVVRTGRRVMYAAERRLARVGTYTERPVGTIALFVHGLEACGRAICIFVPLETLAVDLVCGSIELPAATVGILLFTFHVHLLLFLIFYFIDSLHP